MHSLAVVAVIAVFVAVIAVVVYMNGHPHRRRTDSFTSAKARTFPEMVGMRVSVGKVASKDPSVVSFVVDAAGKIATPPVIPWAGRPVDAVMRAFQRKFGQRFVIGSTKNVAMQKDKVVVIHNATTKRVSKVLVPKQWSIQPDRLSVPRQTRVYLNPAKAAAGLAIVTDTKGVVKSATYRP